MWRVICCVALLGACGTDTGCPESIASYCAANGGCAAAPPLTWAAAQDPRSWGCSTGCPSPNSRLILDTCARGSTAIRAGTDTGTEYHYDASGMLDRITSYGIDRRRCVAGDVADPGQDTTGCMSMMLDLCCPP